MLLTHFDRTARWMRRGGREGDIVLSSRVRVARNLGRTRFPHLATPQELLSIRHRVLRALENVADAAPGPFLLVPFEDFTTWERQSLIDRHLTSRAHIKGELGRALAATSDGALCVLINEEDHLRLQSLLPGLQLDAAYALADKMDDALEAHFDTRGRFAYDEKFGYLTTCPTNAGTGMRVSTMLHLPALEMVGRIDKTRKWAATQGLDLRGTFGEGSKVWGHLHQLSNEATMGLDETEILLQVEAATREICEQERAARDHLVQEQGTLARDHIGRAFGTLRYARAISCHEATDALSFVRLGHELGWMKGFSRQRFCELLVWIRPAYLQVLHGRNIVSNERDILRAKLLRQHIVRVKLEAAFEEAN